MQMALQVIRTARVCVAEGKTAVVLFAGLLTGPSGVAMSGECCHSCGVANGRGSMLDRPNAYAVTGRSRWCSRQNNGKSRQFIGAACVICTASLFPIHHYDLVSSKIVAGEQYRTLAIHYIYYRISPKT